MQGCRGSARIGSGARSAGGLSARGAARAAGGRQKRSPARVIDCEALEKRADAKYRYLLCSTGLFDRKVKGYLLTFDGAVARLPIAQYGGFKSETGPVPEKFADAIPTKSPGDNVLVWSDEDEPILIVRRNVEAKRIVLSTFIVSSKLIDANGLSVGARPEEAWPKNFRNSCRVGRSLILKRGRDGVLTCPIRYVRTNLRRQNLYHAGGAANAVSLLEITHSEPKPAP